MADRDPAALARCYYRDLDDGDYEGLAAKLTPDFRHVRGDRTLEGRDRFVRFMREERPETDTTHEVEAVSVPAKAPDRPGPDEVVVRGRLLRANGSVWFGFVDVFGLDGERFAELVTYTNSRVA
jgi:ketosteroid isomerase-like protein